MPYTDVFDRISTFEWALAGAVFAAVLAVLTFALVRYRAGRRAEASHDTEHPRVEAVYAVVLLLVAVGIVSYTSQVGRRDSAASAATPGLHIQVTGFQWCWRFHYVDRGVTVTASCQDGHYPTLVLPTDRPIRFTATSDDVIHSFWVPHFRYKMDAFPHHTNGFTLTVPEPGHWLGHCAEFCGVDHASMLFEVRAMPPAQFEQWLQAQLASPPAVSTGASPAAVTS